MSAEKVLKRIRDEEIAFVDFELVSEYEVVSYEFDLKNVKLREK